MPLFVPILRLLMLFLNVYDSYKTLKDPPASSRHGGRPSVRAMSQRKRDMKGCVAVWLVWVSLTMYERTIESIIFLFIPFYDEFKSLALLFLILTRARGAEPIYLHLIRPLVKPYTRTLDGALELMLMIGDFIFALSTYPVRIGLQWYRKHFGSWVEAGGTESDTQSSFSSSNEVNASEVPTSFIASSGHALPLEQARKSSTQSLPASKEGNTPRTPPSRNSSDDASRKETTEPPAGFEPDFYDSTRARQSASGFSRSPTRKSTRESAHRQDSGNSISKSSRSRKELGRSTSNHQIWHPPHSSYVDDDLDAKNIEDIQTNEVERATVLTREQQQFEEWRQYPAFPSAYPPTPLVTTSRLAASSNHVSPSLYPPIGEAQEQTNNAQQDFVRSLLPPREPLDPNHARDTSDEHYTFGIVLSSSPSEIEDADDNMSTSDDNEYEDEDDFNMTLRTPLQRLGSLRSQTRAQRLLPINTALSAGSSASIPSRSSALTTAADDKSAAPIGTSSDSSLSPSKPNTSTPSVLGKKRALPRTAKTQVVRNRVRHIEGIDSIETSSRGASESESINDSVHMLQTTLKPQGHQPSTSPNIHVISNEGAVESSGDSISAVDEQEEIPPEEKRRKIVRSIPTRVAKTTHSARPRIPRHVSPPAKAPIRKATITGSRTSGSARAHTINQSHDLVHLSSGISSLRTKGTVTSASKTTGNSSSVLTSDNAGENTVVRKPMKRTAAMKKT